MTIRWGMIGCGKVAEVKSGPALQKAAGSELVMVMRRNAAAAEDYARRHGVPRWTTDAAAVIHDPQVDAVYIATPPGNHLEYALAVAAAGKPAYVEKPMARSYRECCRMNEAFAQAGQPLWVAYYRRRLPRFLKVQELIAAGRLGRVTLLAYHYDDSRLGQVDPHNLPWRLQAVHSGGGNFLDLGSHALDLFTYLLGPIEHLSATAVNLGGVYAVEDVVAMECRFASGVPGAATWNFASAIHQDRIEITGTLGHVTMSCFGNEPLELHTAAGVERFDLPNPPHIQQPLVQSIADQWHGHGSCPSTGQTAAHTSWAMDRALEGYYGSRDDDFWTRPETWPGRRVAG
jgi:1,5-anhydro-D-fructose reductase (1,5-anhydro-D-mannitol-forming)